MAKRREASRHTRRASGEGPQQETTRVTARPRPSTLPWWQPVVLTLLVVLAYANSLSSPFVFDDKLTVVENRQIRDLSTVRSLLLPERELPVAGRPVANISFALNYAVHGLDVRGYRIVNVAIHLLCGLLVLGVTRRTLSSLSTGEWAAASAPATALAVAALWIAHPLNSEAVSYLTQRTELLMACFYLGTLYAAIRANGADHRGLWAAAAIAGCALGMGSKESMVTAPLVVVLYDRVFLFRSLREAMASRWRLYAGLAATWAILGALQSTGPRMHSAGFSVGVSPWTYLLNQTTMIVRYLRLALWPDALVLNYGAPLDLTPGQVWPQALMVGLLFAMSVVALVRWPPLGFLGAWFFITLAPTSSIVPIVTEVGAERRMYLPLVACISLTVLGGLWACRAVTRRRRSGSQGRGDDAADEGRVPPVAAALLAVIVVALVMTTNARNRDYASPLVLAETSYERWPSPVARHMVAAELAIAGRDDEAIHALRDSVKSYPRGNYDLGVVLFQKSEFAEAVRAFEEFVSKEPLLLEVVEARVLTGRALVELQKYPEAIAAFEDALRMRPSRIEVYGLLADVLVKAKRPAEAVLSYRRFLSAFPRDVWALSSLGVLLAEREELTEALELFRRVVEIEPDNAAGQRNLAGVLLNNGDVAGAIEHARRAVALAPADALALDLLGMALIADGQTPEAVRAFDQASRIAPGDSEIRDHLQAALARDSGGNRARRP